MNYPCGSRMKYIMNREELNEQVKKLMWSLTQETRNKYHAGPGVYRTGIETMLYDTYKAELCVEIKGYYWMFKYRFPELFGMTQRTNWTVGTKGEEQLMRRLVEDFDSVRNNILLQIENKEALPLQNPEKIFRANLKRQKHLAHHDGEKVALNLVDDPKWWGKNVIRCIFPDKTSAGIRKCDLYDLKEDAVCLTI